MTFVCQPQVKDLPRDGMIGVTCQSCGKSWSDSVRDMVEQRHLGAQYMDLLEFEARCNDAFCGGFVAFEYDGKPETRPFKPRMVTPARPKAEPMPYPVKAVVRPRQYTLSQYTLPMAMPPVRPVKPGKIVSVARG